MLRRLVLCLLALGALEAEARAAEPPTVVWEVAHDGGPVRPSNTDAPMAFDEARNQTVLFSDWETWLWNGSKWTNAHPALAPTGRAYSMAYDRARARSVMIVLGGQTNETWEWNGTNWSQAAKTAPDFGRVFYDENLSKVVALSATQFQASTFAWNGSTWTKLNPAHSPPATTLPGCLGYDPVRRRAVAFGGLVGSTEINETWEWDGVDWFLALPAHAPSARVGCRLGFTGGSMLLYGGASSSGPSVANESWTWDGIDWTLTSSATFPTPKTNSSLSFDRARSRLVLFGSYSSSGGTRDDTLEFDGTAWLDRTLHDHPLGRIYGDTVVYDDALGGIVLIDWYFRETWLWSGTSWTSLPTAHFPDGAPSDTVAYDRSRSRIVVVTASTIGTWEFDGVDWIHRQPVTPTPDARLLAYDAKRARVVLLSSGTPSTWEWDGTDWSMRAAANANLPYGSSMAFDEARGVTVLFGQGNGPYPETWTWDGLGWTKKSPPTNPENGRVFYDSARQRIISFSSPPFLWEWDGNDWSKIDYGLFPDPSASLQFIAFDRGRSRFAVYAPRHYATWELHMRGGLCSTGSECDSQICEDGTCCETKCGGSNDCMACSKAAGALDEGICGVVAITTLCRASVAACDELEACDGVSGACPGDGFALLGKACAAPRCDGNDFVSAAFCTGAGAACPPAVTTPCAPYVCKVGTGCAISCATSAECVDGTACEHGQCVPPTVDAGTDATTSPDAGAGDSPSMGGGGCDCEATGRSIPSPPAATLIAVGLAALTVRRRRRGRP